MNSRLTYYHQVGVFARWFFAKYQEQAQLNGTQYAARNLRKQGIPVEHAVHILARRPGPPVLDFTR